MHGRKQFHSIGCFESINESGDTLKPSFCLRVIEKKVLSRLGCPGCQFNLLLWVVFSIAIPLDKVALY